MSRVQGFLFLGLFCGSFAAGDTSTKSVCGLTGPLDQRIEDCRSSSDSDPYRFLLVTRDAKQQEIYYEHFSGLLWGPIASRPDAWTPANQACEGNQITIDGFPALQWRLPSRPEYFSAYKISAIQKLPGMMNLFWANRHYRGGFTEYGFIFDGRADADESAINARMGAMNYRDPILYRCVAEHPGWP